MTHMRLSMVGIALVVLCVSLIFNQPTYSSSDVVSPLSPLYTYLPISTTPFLTLRIVLWRDTNRDNLLDDDEMLPSQIVRVKTGIASMIQITNNQGSVTFVFESGLWKIEACGLTYSIDATYHRFVPGLLILKCTY